MELKTKYQYTYFIYPFVISEKKYNDFLAKIIMDKNWNVKIFQKDVDIEADSHFLSIAKQTMFPTLEWTKEKIETFQKEKNYEKAKILSKMKSCSFEYDMKEISKGKAGVDENAIFFEITKIKLMCFQNGICFLFLKTEIDNTNYIAFSDVLNLNYKFRNISPKYNRFKDYDYIKIQTNRFETMENICEFLRHICSGYEDASKKDIYSNRLFVYSYACLDESEWNTTTEFTKIKNEFLKYQYVLSGDYGSEFAEDIKMDNTYSRWKYSIYGFTKTAGVVFSSATDHFNFTKLPFYYETVYIYIMLYALYQRLSYLILLQQMKEKKTQRYWRKKIQEVTLATAIGQVSSAEHCMSLWQNWSKAFGLQEMYNYVMKQYLLIRKKE